MVDLNKAVALARLVVYSTASVFALLAMIMSALVINFTSSLFGGAYFTYSALGMATAILTFLTLPLMLFLSFRRKGAFTSMVIVELIWTWLLWVLWLSAGANVAGSLWINNCTSFYARDTEAACMESQALAAFSFLNWIMLMAFEFTLLGLTIRQQTRGNPCWTQDVTEVDYAGAGNASSIPSVMMDQKIDSSNFAPQYADPNIPQYTGSTIPHQPSPVLIPQAPGTPTYPQV
jgi:hypothetical protein